MAQWYIDVHEINAGRHNLLRRLLTEARAVSFEHPYPDYAYLDLDAETNDKRWFSSKGMGVCYVHEDRAGEDVAAAVKAERDACAQKAREFAAHYDQGSDGRNTFIILAEWIENREVE